MQNIIPVPSKCNKLHGEFELTQQTRILYSKGTRLGRKIAQGFANFLEIPMGQKLEIASFDSIANSEQAIVLTTKNAPKRLGSEGYKLTIKPSGVLIHAAKPAGLFYGLQSLRQLLPPSIESNQPLKRKKIAIGCIKIEDVPRFKWRGMHYDPCRRFFGVDHVLEYIDFLAMQKFNILHFHLTEDQGWRIEIKKYPKLTEIGAWRNGTSHYYFKSKGDRKKHGGFYTQDDIRKIVKYAADRFITVVPEIEMPGHAQAAIAAYPELSCTGGPHKVWTKWGISKDVYCAGNEKVFKFLEDVLEEVFDLFPSKFIHIGGDECPKDRWKKCPKCQKRIKSENLADENELQSYFIKRMEKFINARGRKIIGWDEILQGGLAPNAAVMSWRGFEGGIDAASQGHYVVMTPRTHTYLDCKPFAETKSGQPCVIPIEKVYSFDPTEGFKPAWKKFVLGGQGAMWSEYMNNLEEFYHHFFPRVCAISEVLWSSKKRLNFKNFKKRLNAFMKRIDNSGTNTTL